MAKKSSRPVNVKIIKAADRPGEKAETSTQITQQQAYNAGDWITPPLDMRGLRKLVKESSILPQCIRAYKNNIAGFGLGVRYREDVEETPEMAAEFQRVEEIVELLNIEQDTKEVFEDIIEAREIYGISYIEVIRNVAGDVEQIEFIKDTPSVQKTKPLEPYAPTYFFHHGQTVERKKKYCKYKQQIGGQTVYFKEFGDPRVMDNRNGEYLKDGEVIELEYHANEIIEFTVGTEPYGEVRWVGQILGVDGSRKAEGLNNNYFENGRHTPLMIMVEGGTLTDESFEKLTQYMNEIKGESGQHAFIILETEANDGRVDFDQTEKPKIEVKDLASILQKDELFQEYLDNNRRRVQSAFQLPDLYVGYTTDFNRATAQTAMEVTEEQVFQPERKSLAWVLNNRLLNGYQLQYTEVYFLEPDTSNPDDLFKMLTVCNNAGGLTPNKAKEIVYNMFGETSEGFPEEWGDVPLAYSKTQSNAGAFDIGSLTMSLQKQIEKAAGNHDDAVVAVMKEVKKTLKNFENHFTNVSRKSIIRNEWNEDDHPRDEHGRFSSGGGDSSDGGDGDGSSDTQGDGGGGAAPARGDFGGADTATFTVAVQAAKDSRPPEDAWRVTAMSKEEFEQEHPGACCHITLGGSVVAVTKDGDIVSVCKAVDDNTTRGSQLLQMAVDAGGTKLDSYDGNHGFYASRGFEPVSWCKWDDNYAPEGWDASRDSREDIIFYKYTGNNSSYLTAQSFKDAIPASKDYGEAYEKRDSSL